MNSGLLTTRSTGRVKIEGGDATLRPTSRTRISGTPAIDIDVAGLKVRLHIRAPMIAAGAIRQ